MTEEASPEPDVELSEVAAEQPEESVARQEDVVEGEPGWAPEGHDPGDDGQHVPPS
jgi:hypothetical protein